MLGRHERCLSGFAAEPQHDVRGDVGMLGETGERSSQQLMLIPSVVVRAAFFVGECDDSVDVWVGVEDRLIEVGGDVFGTRCRAVHRADDADVIPSRDAPVRSNDALKSATGNWVRIGGNLRSERVVQVEFSRSHIVSVYPLPRSDVLRREADHLSELANRLSRLDLL